MSYLKRTELGQAGLSSRAVNALHNMGITSLDQLRRTEWFPVGSEVGLQRELMRSPNCGERTTNEIAAFLHQMPVAETKAKRPTIEELEIRIAKMESQIAELLKRP